MLEKLKTDYGDQLHLVYRHLPLITIHDKAQVTAEAAEAAGAQGKFWEMHDILFERQSEWNSRAEADMIEVLVSYAEEIGLEDIQRFQSELKTDAYADKVLADYNAAGQANLTGTPAIFVNQVDYPLRAFGISYEGLNFFIKLMQLRTQYAGPTQVIDPEKEYIATIKTESGDIVLELYPDTAPINVNSFAFLAQQGWYKDVTFHRVLPGFVAQGGDPSATGFGFPGYQCGDEVTPSRTFDGAGLVSLANSGPNSNGSQFFITYDATPTLNENFTIIGRVIEGMEVAESITPRDPQSNPNAPPGDKIIDIIVEEKS